MSGHDKKSQDLTKMLRTSEWLKFNKRYIVGKLLSVIFKWRYNMQNSKVRKIGLEMNKFEFTLLRRFISVKHNSQKTLECAF